MAQKYMLAAPSLYTQQTSNNYDMWYAKVFPGCP